MYVHTQLILWGRFPVVKLTAISTVGKSPSFCETLFSQQLSKIVRSESCPELRESRHFFPSLLNIYFNIYLFIYAYFFEFFSSLQDFLISSWHLVACVYTAKLTLKSLHSTHTAHICELYNTPNKEPAFLCLLLHYFSFYWNKTVLCEGRTESLHRERSVRFIFFLDKETLLHRKPAFID